MQKEEVISSRDVVSIHSDDFIFKFLLNHFCGDEQQARSYYFEDGRHSADVLRRLIGGDTAVGNREDFSLLEFASGYGCVSRHLPAVFPRARILACDIHQAAVDFTAKELGIDAVLSKSAPLELNIGEEFDVVFALSFFSHMPDRTFGLWLHSLFRHVKPGGSLIFTAHGERSRTIMAGDSFEFSEGGFWFQSASEQGDLDGEDYGTAMSTTQYVSRLVYRLLRAPIALVITGLWWGHQDLYIVAKPSALGA